MNFHKTIGFLAALLLTLGIGVPDSFAQSISTVTFTIPDNASSVTEGMTTTLAVTVTLDAAPTADVPVTLTAMVGAEMVGSGTVTVLSGESIREGTMMVMPPDDADAMNTRIVVTATAVGYTPASVVIPVNDDEGTITVTVDPTTAVAEGEEATVTVTATLTDSDASADNVDADTPVVVTAMVGAMSIGSTTVTVEANSNTGVSQDEDSGPPVIPATHLTFTPPHDMDADDGMVTFSATLSGYVSTDAMVDITDDEVEITGVTFDPASLTEGSAATTVSVTVTTSRNVDADTDVTVTLTDEDGYQTLVTVTVSLGSNSGVNSDLVITPANDSDMDDGAFTVTAKSGDHIPLAMPVKLPIRDDDKVPLSLMLDPSSIMEGQTTTVNVKTILGALDRVASTEVTVTATLGASAFTEIATVTSDSTYSTVRLSITPPNDEVYMEEQRTILITGVSGTGDDQITASATLTVQDDDGTQILSLALDPSSITEQDAAQNVTANVSFTLPVDAATMVNVSANVGGQDATTTITVPAGGKTGSGMLSVMTADANQTDETVVVSAQSGKFSGTANLMVVDDDKPTGMPLTISANISGIRENVRRDVEVTAKLPAAPAAGTTVMVTVTAMDGMTSAGSGTITIVGPATEGMATIRIMPNNDNEYTTRDIVVTGSASGYDDGMAMIDVIEDDGTVGEIKISAAPPSVTVGTGSQVVNLTVNVIGQTDTPEGTTVVVNLATTPGSSLSPDMVTVTLTNDPNKDPATYRTQTRTGAHRGSATLTVNTGTTAGEVATVTGTAAGYTEGKRTISALSRDAEDVVGYRVAITNRANGAWVPAGDKRVVVEVIRLGGIAAPWTGFVSIAATLKDTSGTEVGDKLMASNFNDDGGTITFTKDGPKGKISYLTTDRLKFEIQVPFHGTINNTNPNAATRRPVNPADNPEGQYMGVYAEVDFVIGSTTTTLTNRQTDKPVYPVESVLPSLVPNVGDRYVGDGILVKVDNIKPGVDTQTGLGTNISLLAPVVTSGDESGTDIGATVGEEIRVAIGIASSGRLFRHAGAQAQLRIRANTAQYMGTTPTPTIERAIKTVNYTPLQIINAARNSDSIFATWTVTEGLFLAEVDDFIEGIGPDGTRFVADNAKVYVRVRVKDQASNWSGWRNSPIFDADSRLPGVSILYPSAAPDSMYAHSHSLRFTGATESIVDGQNFDDFLNPLRIAVDEEVSALQIFAVGSDTLDLDETMVVAGDSLAYDSSMLNSTEKDDDGNFKLSSKNRAGTAMELAVLATDLLGNTTKVTIPGVTHDASAPVLSNWFPKNSLIPDGQINDATRHPVLELSEDVDSIAVTFTASNGATVTEEVAGGDTKGETQVVVSDALQHNQTYTMTVFVRDLAGNVYISPADSSSNMKFNSQFDNPVANSYKISAKTDSVIAGQANMLTIQAEDHDAESDTKRNALTYKNAVRISAWDADGGVAESVWFEGAGVDDDADNPDGMATLNAADWKIGKRSVTVKSNMAGAIKVLLQHLDSGMDGTEVLGFDSAINLYVGAADFNGFDITAWEDDADMAVQDVWTDFTLRVVPIDRHGNPSVRVFKSGYDSLDVLDTRAKDNAIEYKNGIDVTFGSVPVLEELSLLVWPVGIEGANFDVMAPEDRRTLTVQVRVDNEALHADDTRSQNIRSTVQFKIAAPLTPVLTLWVPDSDMDEAGNDVVVPADGDVMVTVAAEGFKAGSMVTFTKDGTALDAMEANDDGVAKLMITMSEAGSVTVSATDGRYSTDELEVVFVDTPPEPPEPARKSYADANGDPVYLISDADMTVGVDDFLALVAAFGSSDGDDNYNAQADVNDDGMVDVADFLEFITSFGRTAVGPATKPLVLAPGINENAEFSLSLGSERVVAGELVAVDVSLANVAAVVGYGFALNYETDKFEFVSAAPADEDLLKSTGGETLFHHVVADGQVTVANGLYNGTAVSGGGGVVQFVFRVLREFEDNARFEIADGVVFDPSQLQNPAVVAGVLELQSTPREFALHQNFPNPFNPDTTIKYDLAESADVTLQIYNVLGQVVRTLIASEAQNAGRYQIRWNGMDDRGVPVSSGIYFYQVSADGKFSDVRKLMLLK